MTMSHKNNFVVCIKHAGKVLRESENKVYLPFGSEYSVFLRNLESRRAQVNVFIDGAPVAERLVINANSSLDLERFLDGSNLLAGNRFKFIERNAAVEAARGGPQAEDGLVTVRLKYEKLTWSYYPYATGVVTTNLSDCVIKSSALRGVIYDSHVQTTATYSGLSHGVNCNDSLVVAQNCSAGITAPGSISNQSFVTVSSFPLEDTETVITLQLIGQIEARKVKAPVTVKNVPRCRTCNTKSKSAKERFCSACGSSLEVAELV